MLMGKGIKIISILLLLAFASVGAVGAPPAKNADAKAAKAAAADKADPGDRDALKFMEQPETELGACEAAAGVDPANYTIVVGDQFRLGMIRVGHESNTYEISVLPEGKVILPFIGESQASGLKLSDFTKKTLDTYRGKFKDIQFALQLSCLGTYEVMVVGAVNAPGVYLINSRARLTTVIRKAQGWQPYGSVRSIKLQNPAGSAIYDLQRFFSNGDLSQNPFVPPGSSVNVPGVFGRVDISGEVNAPGKYEIVESDTIDDLARFAYGFTAKADRDKIIVKRYIRSAEGKYVFEKKPAYSAGASGPAPLKLMDGDEVDVASFGQNKGGVVQMFGAVKLPAGYDAYEGITVFDLIRMAGGYTGLMAPDKAYVFTTDDSGTPIKKTVDLMNTSDPEALVVKPGSRVYIFSTEMRQKMVSVEGNVQSPGYYPYSEGITVFDVINMAGGVNYAPRNMEAGADQNAGQAQAAAGVVKPSGVVNLRSSFILRGGEGVRHEEQFIPLRLDKLLFEQDMSANAPLQPGDRIVIPEATDYVIVSGFVTKPGTYPFIGNLQAIHYASMAGLTSDADINKIAIQRASGELTNNPDAIVNPGDVVVVYEKSSRSNERKFGFYSSAVSTMLLILNYLNNH